MKIEEINFLLEKFSSEKSDISISASIEKDIFILNFSGVIDTYNSCSIEKVLLSFLKSSNITKLVLNLKSVNYISSTGIGLFTTLLKKCKSENIYFAIFNAQPKIKEILDLLGFTNFLNVIENIEDINIKKENIFPKKIKCNQCNATLIAPRSGKFICKACKNNFTIDEKGNIKN